MPSTKDLFIQTCNFLTRIVAKMAIIGVSGIRDMSHIPVILYGIQVSATFSSFVYRRSLILAMFCLPDNLSNIRVSKIQNSNI